MRTRRLFSNRLATVNIFKQDIKFSVAHFTIFSETNRERLHGHNYNVSVSLSGFVDENGLISDYRDIKDTMRSICRELDEYTLIPLESRFLIIKSDEKRVSVVFNGEEMVFPMGDVKLLPMTNITGEDLSFYISTRLKEELRGNYSNLVVNVSSGAGQSISTESHNPMPKLKKRLVIAGGSSGIGRSIIEEFKLHGYDVTNISRRNVENCDNLHLDLAKIDDLAKVNNLDVSGEITFVYAAGVHPEDSIHTLDSTEMQNAMNVNVIAPGILTSRLIPKMSSGSSVIFIGSTLSSKAIANRLSYVTSKHAMIGLMKSITQDLDGKGIHTCCVCPGFTDTPMLQSAIGDNKPQFDRFIQDFCLFKRLISPGEIAKLVFQASNSPILNGSVIHANLGQKEK